MHIRGDVSLPAAAAKSLQSGLTLRPHRRWPTRLPCPWDSPGKNTGVGCHFLLLLSYKEAESVRGRRKQGSLGFQLAGPWSTGVVNITWLDPPDTRGIIVCIRSGPIENFHAFPPFYAHHLCLQTSFPWSHDGRAWNPPFRISCRDSLMLVTFFTFMVLKMCLFGPRSWKAFSLGIFFRVMEVAFHGLLVFFPAGQVNRQRYSPENNLSPSLAAFQIRLTFEHHGG